MQFCLDLPFGYKRDDVTFQSNVKWGPGKVQVYKGPILPRELLPFRSEDFSWLRWVEDEINSIVLPPTKSDSIFTPFEHQKEDAKKIAKWYEDGLRGCLLASSTGVGKTLSALAGVVLSAKNAGFSNANKAKVLIVCPKSVIPTWRQTLHSYPPSAAFLRPMIINYQSAHKLIQPPANIRVQDRKAKSRVKNKKTAYRNGTPTIDWDFIIFDESHYLKNFGQSDVSIIASTLAKLQSPYIKGQSPFVIFATATPGATPLNLAVMSGILAPFLADGESKQIVKGEETECFDYRNGNKMISLPKDVVKNIGPLEWGGFLEKIGFAVTKGKGNTYTWATVPWYGKNGTKAEQLKFQKAEEEAKQKQRIDARRIGKALMHEKAPFIKRSPKDIAGWPEQNIMPYYIDLNPKQRSIYETAWTAFRSWLRLTPAKRDPKGALVENLRYRQKTSLLKVEGMVEQIKDWVEADYQVYVSVEFMETLDKYKEELSKLGIACSEISGRTTDTREEERLKFQRGETKVVLCSVVAGISLHANETLPDGSKATPNERITVLSDIRQNNLDNTQAMGRCHRSSENSIAYIPVLTDTVDIRVVESFINKTANMNTMTTEEDPEFMERIFRQSAAKSE